MGVAVGSEARSWSWWDEEKTGRQAKCTHDASSRKKPLCWQPRCDATRQLSLLAELWMRCKVSRP